MKTIKISLTSLWSFLNGTNAKICCIICQIFDHLKSEKVSECGGLFALSLIIFKGKKEKIAVDYLPNL